MKIVAVSDIHGSHMQCPLVEGDVLVCAGDITSSGGMDALGDVAQWLAAYPTKHKVVVAGNHDWCFYGKRAAKGRKILEDNQITYLQDDGCVIEGIRFWGSPWQPEFCNWAFNLPRGSALRKKWSLAPEDTDVLITHGPPYGIRDRVSPTQNPLGCVDLLEEVVDRIRPKLHIFGHIHAGYGVEERHGTTYMNAALLDESYSLENKPLEIEI